jgi:putative transcriptional regulator
LIKFKLKELLEEKEMTMYQLSKQGELRPNTVSQWVNNNELDEKQKVKSISLDTLDTICKTLNCKLEDVIEYVNEQKTI